MRHAFVLFMLLHLHACAKVVATEAAVVVKVEPNIGESSECWRREDEPNPDGLPHYCKLKLRLNDIIFTYFSDPTYPCRHDAVREKCMMLVEGEVVEVLHYDDGTYGWKLGNQVVTLH